MDQRSACAEVYDVAARDVPAAATHALLERLRAWRASCTDAIDTIDAQVHPPHMPVCCASDHNILDVLFDAGAPHQAAGQDGGRAEGAPQGGGELI